ncbi:MAG: ComEC/Rec2 family competence protein [Deltaproteobacteria bacterium]|nr:ComEC/Rec2 family competence protein [Deltaproteobacteria bacterium]
MRAQINEFTELQQSNTSCNRIARPLTAILLVQQICQFGVYYSSSPRLYVILILIIGMVAYVAYCHKKQVFKKIFVVPFIVCWCLLNCYLVKTLQHFDLGCDNAQRCEKSISGEVVSINHSRNGVSSIDLKTPYSKKLIRLSYYEIPWSLEPCIERGANLRISADITYIQNNIPLQSIIGYDAYLLRQGIIASGKVLNVVGCNPPVVKSWRSNFIITAIADFGKTEQLAVMLATVLGIEDLLGSEVQGLFTGTGTSHLVVISGFHITLVFAAFYFIFLNIIKKSIKLTNRLPADIPATVISLLVCLAYTYISGFEVSSTRALISMTLYSCLRLLFRNIAGSVSIIFSAILICLIWPLAVLDLSFQYSFMAVIGLYVASCFQVGGLKLELLKRFSPKSFPTLRLVFINSFVYCFFAWLFTLPISVYWFNSFTLYGAIINLFLIPAYSILVLYPGIVSILCYFCHTAFCKELVKAALVVTHLFLDLLENVFILNNNLQVYSGEMVIELRNSIIALSSLIVLTVTLVAQRKVHIESIRK